MPTRANVQETDTGATPASSLTLSSYAPAAGSDRVLEVMVAYGRTLTPSCTVTFGGVAMTSRGGQALSGSLAIAVQAFTLNEADWPATPANIVATLNGTGGIRIVASTITDVDQTSPMDATPVIYTPALNTNPWSIAITTNTANAMVSAFGSGSEARTLSSIGAGQDQIRLDTDAVEVSTVDILRTLLWEDAAVPTPTTVTMTATWSAAIARSAGVVLAYKPAPVGPTITVQPANDVGIISNGQSTVYTTTATGTTISAVTWSEDTIPLADGGIYDISTTGIGTGSVTSTLTITRTSKTGTPWDIKANVVDANGNTDTNTVTDTWWTGPQLTTFPATNGSGVSTATLTCDYVTGVGEAIEVRIPLPDGDVAVTVTTT